ncbi:MAG: helix-turn-helix domain-containing protein [Actinomycetota bacterium]|nr:helix-turn-helix domain-containing protein [Actinomycetota bacterium]
MPNTRCSCPDHPRRPLATITDVAEYLGVPVQTVYRWNTRGTGPRVFKVGRHARYRWEDVEKWIEDDTLAG